LQKSNLLEESNQNQTESRDRSYDAKKAIPSMKQQKSRDNSLTGTLPRTGSKEGSQNKPQTRGGGRQAQIVNLFYTWLKSEA
jgi:hypothetical protein